MSARYAEEKHLFLLQRIETILQASRLKPRHSTDYIVPAILMSNSRQIFNHNVTTKGYTLPKLYREVYGLTELLQLLTL